MTFLLGIIEGLHSFLNYLEISPKYLNRAYTLLGIIPTLYILRIVYGLAQNGNYLQFVLYLLAFVVLAYFIVLNAFYYFFDKNSKADVTQLFVKYLPDDAFNIQDKKQPTQAVLDELNTEEISVEYFEDYQLRLADNMRELIAAGQIKTCDLTKTDGFLVAANTLYPYYFVKKLDETTYSLRIGRSYSALEEVGRIRLPRHSAALQPVGLFIVGGDFVRNGLRYHEPYRLKLMVKKAQPTTAQISRTSRANNQAQQPLSRAAARSQRHH